jgi:hypothetical protein
MRLRGRAHVVDAAALPVAYRYLFFGWLFADVGGASDPIERRARWRHNREMSKYLPTYLRRWSALFALAFGAGWLCETWLQTTLLAACCYTGSCVAVPVMAVIVVAWLFLTGWQVPD